MSEGSARRFAGAVAVVTGAAHGIGAAAARRLADEDAEVWLVDVDGDAVTSVAEDLIARGASARPVVADVADPASWTGIAAQLEDGPGRLDLLHCNAFV